jgi:hypothetical protein
MSANRVSAREWRTKLLQLADNVGHELILKELVQNMSGAEAEKAFENASDLYDYPG